MRSMGRNVVFLPSITLVQMAIVLLKDYRRSIIKLQIDIIVVTNHPRPPSTSPTMAFGEANVAKHTDLGYYNNTIL